VSVAEQKEEEGGEGEGEIENKHITEMR